MLRRLAVIAAVVSFSAFATSASDAQGPFEPACAVPIGDIAAHHGIDDDCGREGKPTSSAPSKLQSVAKNNFCATPADTVLITRTSFRRLQTAVDKLDPNEFTLGAPTKLPSSRDILINMHVTTEGASVGEGTKVQFVAFIWKGNYSNTSNGESVNCNLSGVENNDIHLYLGNHRVPGDLCDTVTAEISPHFRPEPWTVLGRLKATKTKTVLQKLEALDLDRPIRWTGHLMLDASHQPCRTGKPASPARFSSWEIHPVYAIDVCSFKSLANCKVDADVWTPLHEWLESQDETEEDIGDEGV